MPLWAQRAEEELATAAPAPVSDQPPLVDQAFSDRQQERQIKRDESVYGLGGQIQRAFDEGDALAVPPVAQVIGTTLAEARGTSVDPMLEITPEDRERLRGQLVAEEEPEHPGWLWAAQFAPPVAAGMAGKKILQGIMSGEAAQVGAGLVDVPLAFIPGAANLRRLAARAMEGDQEAIQQMPVVRIGQILSTLQRPLAAALRDIAENDVVRKYGRAATGGRRVWTDPNTGEELEEKSALDIAQDVVSAANPMPDGRHDVSYVDVFGRLSQASGGTGDEWWIWLPGIGGDILLDPATYLSFGGTGVVKASRQVQRVVYQSLRRAGDPDAIGKAAKVAQYVRSTIGLKSRDEVLGPASDFVRRYVQGEAQKLATAATPQMEPVILGEQAARQIMEFGQSWGQEGLKLTLPLGSRGRILAASDNGKWLEDGVSRSVGELIPGEHLASLRRAIVGEAQDATRKTAEALNEFAARNAAKGGDLEPGLGDRKVRAFRKFMVSIFDNVASNTMPLPGAKGGVDEMMRAAERQKDVLAHEQRKWETKLVTMSETADRSMADYRRAGVVMDKPRALEYARRKAGESLQHDEFQDLLLAASQDMASAAVAKLPGLTPEQARLAGTLSKQQEMASSFLQRMIGGLEKHFGKTESTPEGVETKSATAAERIAVATGKTAAHQIGTAAKSVTRDVVANHVDALRRWASLGEAERQSTAMFVQSSIHRSNKLVDGLIRKLLKSSPKKQAQLYGTLVEFEENGQKLKGSIFDILSRIRDDQRDILIELESKTDAGKLAMNEEVAAAAANVVEKSRVRLRSLLDQQSDVFSGIMAANRGQTIKMVESIDKMLEKMWKHGQRRLAGTPAPKLDRVPAMSLDRKTWDGVRRSVSSAYASAIVGANTAQEASVLFQTKLADHLRPFFNKDEFQFIEQRLLAAPWKQRVSSNVADDWHGYRAEVNQLDTALQGLVRFAADIFDELLKKEQAAGIPVERLAAYIPHILRNKDPLSQEVGLKRMLGGTAEKFTKHRVTDSFDELRELGLEPSTHIMEILAARVYAHNQAMGHYRFMDDVIDKLTKHHGAVALQRGLTEEAARKIAQGKEMAQRFGVEAGGVAPVHVQWRDRFYVLHPDQLHAWNRIEALLDPVQREHVLRRLIGMMNWWKSAATVARPGFHIRNMWSNAWNMYLGGWSGRNLKRALDVGNVGYLESTEEALALGRQFREPGKKLDAIGQATEWMRQKLIDRANKFADRVAVQSSTGREFTYRELYRLAAQHGVVDKGWVAMDIERSMMEEVVGSGSKSIIGKLLASGNPFGRDWILTKAGNKGGRGIENHARLTLFLDRILTDGDAPEDAARHVKKFLFDYKDLSKVDRVIKLSGLAPFWCVPEDHTILTKEGWKHYSDLTIGEPVMVLDPQTHEMRWEPLLDVATFQFDGNLRKVKRRLAEFLFTDDHRWPYQTSESFTRGKWYGGYRGIARANEFTTGHKVPLKGEFQGTESVLSPRHASILGWVVTDGYGRWRSRHEGNSPSWEAVVYQHPKKYLREIVELLGTKPRKPHPATGVVAVGVSTSDRKEIVKYYQEKKDLPGIVTRLSRESAEAMWQAMYKAEGSTGPDGYQHFAQDNGPVLEAFQILSYMTGRSCWLNDRGASLRSRQHLLNINNYEHIHYKGTIWCPRTPTGTWIMRHGGAVIPTGNTWTRKNLPLQMEMMLKSPGKMAMPMKTKRWSDRAYQRYQDDYRKVAYQMLPDYMRRAHGYNWIGDAPIPIKEDLGTPMVFSPDMPYRDLNVMDIDEDEGFFGFLTPIPRYFSESLHPFLKLPLEMAMKKRLQTQQPFAAGEVPRYNVPFTEVPVSVAPFIPTWDGRTQDEIDAGAPERPMADERYVYLLSTLFPDITTWGRTFGQIGRGAEWLGEKAGLKSTPSMSPEEAEKQITQFAADWSGLGRFRPANKEKTEAGWATGQREAIKKYMRKPQR